ncbi:MAG: sugar phosphate isomerase/epimerase [Gemmataceae bacterium]|nr:sugar phosphate isomerase/epimerase [Gemmataceae bacterium]MDW8264442.1 sugar phosphate isomerase/epimerase family protein [Gemmataceae bacterium]
MKSVTRRDFLQAGGALAAGVAAGPAAIAASAAPPAAAPAEPIKFRLGIVTYNVAAQWDLPTILKVCRSVGLAAVELRTTHKHGVEPSLGPAERAEVKKRFADAGVEVWGCGTVCEFHSPDPAVVRKNIETCKAFVGLTADIGGRGVKVRPNALPKEVPVEKTLEQIGKALAECGKAAADANLEIWLEVHGPGTSLPAHCRSIMQHCGHPSVGLTWNSNATDLVNGSVSEAFQMLRPWIRSCHINELYKDAFGVYPYRELFRLLRQTGYDRVTLCEIGKTPPDAASGEELLRYYKALWLSLVRDC